MIALDMLLFVSAVVLFGGKPWAWELAVIVLVTDGGRHLSLDLINRVYIIPTKIHEWPALGVGILVLLLQAVALIGVFVNQEYFDAPSTDYLKSKLEQYTVDR